MWLHTEKFQKIKKFKYIQYPKNEGESEKICENSYI